MLEQVKEPPRLKRKMLEIWRTVKLGTGLETVDDFCRAIENSGMEVDEWGDSILSGMEPNSISEKEVEVDLVLCTTVQLTGRQKGATTAQVFAGAARLHLEKCPAEVGPQLRLQYPDQLSGVRVAVGMEPILSSTGNLDVFNMVRSNGKLILSGSYGDPDYIYAPDTQWAFVLPRKLTQLNSPKG